MKKPPFGTLSPMTPQEKRTVLFVMGAFFLLSGLAFTWFTLGAPAAQVLAARGWMELPCTLLESKVASRPPSHDAYEVRVQYAYEVGGTRYVGTRFDFLNIGRSAHAELDPELEPYPPGATTVCYVNPDVPSASVLIRKFRAKYALSSLLGLLWVGIGIVMAVCGWMTTAKPPPP